MVKVKIFLTFATFFLIIQLAHAQVNLSFGAEIGINYSGTPYIDKYEIPNRKDLVKVKYMPILSPKIGLWAEIKMGRHLYSNFGVQYFKVGNKYHYHRDGNDLLYGGTYKSDHWEIIVLDRASFPISLGYDFKIKKRTLRAGIGYKINHNIKGKFRERHLFIKENQTPTIDRDVTSDIFDENQFSRIADKWNSGVFLECAINLNKKLNLECSYTLNEVIRFADYDGLSGDYYFYRNSDFSIAFKYSIR